MRKKSTQPQEPVDWLQYENQAYEDGYRIVCGVDEAGRGPLAGPVFAAAVVLRPGQLIEGANDSKKLSEKKREALFDIICAEAVDYCIASVDEKTIDEINILQATYLAMTRAVEGLKNPPELCLIDVSMKAMHAVSAFSSGEMSAMECAEILCEEFVYKLKG